MGMLALLLIQMFPQLLLVVAIYLIVLNTGAIFRFLGLNTFTALIIVYLGGALGVNTWLMKGFFDTIPSRAGRVGARRRRDARRRSSGASSCRSPRRCSPSSGSSPSSRR